MRSCTFPTQIANSGKQSLKPKAPSTKLQVPNSKLADQTTPLLRDLSLRVTALYYFCANAEGSHNGSAAVLKTAGRKAMQVRVLSPPPLLSNNLTAVHSAQAPSIPVWHMKSGSTELRSGKFQNRAGLLTAKLLTKGQNVCHHGRRIPGVTFTREKTDVCHNR